MKFQTCRRHPSAGRFLAECSGCKQELFDIQAGNERAAAERKAAALAAKVRTALGLPRTYPAPRTEEGETATRVLVWSVRELQEVFAYVGGTVTAREVERAISDGTTYTVIEVTITVDLDGSEVEVFTDWDAADEPHGFGLPVIVALNRVPVAV